MILRHTQTASVTGVIYGLGGPPHLAIVTIGDRRDYIRVFLQSYC